MELRKVYGIYPTGFHWGRFTVKRTTCTKCGEYSLVQTVAQNGVAMSESCGNVKCWEEPIKLNMSSLYGKLGDMK